MPDFDALPFPIGGTAGVSGATDLAHLEGREFVIEDRDYSSSTGGPRSGYTGPDSRIVKIVRNSSGVALLPCLAVQYRSGYSGRQVVGYTATNPSRPAGFVDEFLPAAGVANNDLFYIAVSGLVSYKVSATASEAVLVAGEYLTTVTAAASTTSTTAGRLTAAVTSGATAVLAAQLLNVIGINVSAATTADTNTNKLMRILNRL